MKAFYFSATSTMKFLLLALTRWHVEGKENVPLKGPLIVISNHLSLIDPPLLSASVPRDIVFMAKEELFQSRGRYVIRAFGAFPVKRGVMDRDALRKAYKVLEDGRVLGMFPEGKRSRTLQLQAAEAGVSLIASRSAAPVLPVAISGSEAVTGPGFIAHRPRIEVIIGKPFIVPSVSGKVSRSDMDELSGLCMKRIAELLPGERRGVYAIRAPQGVPGGS